MGKLLGASADLWGVVASSLESVSSCLVRRKHWKAVVILGAKDEFFFLIYREKARVIYLQTALLSSIAGGAKTVFDRKSSNPQYLETRLLFVYVA